jgi:hypothetical protein
MDMDMIAGMIFTLLILIVVGGFMLLFPITRRLGALLEQRLQGKQTGGDPRELAELRKAIRDLREEVERLAEQQAFTDSLLEARNSPLLAPGAPAPGVRHEHEPRSDPPA